MTQYLTALEALTGAKAAYKAGTLQAQQNSTEPRDCMYRDQQGYGCAIGVSLSDETISALMGKSLNESSIEHVINCGFVETDNSGVLSTLQGYHDNWLIPNVGDNEKMFIEYIDEQLEELAVVG